MKYQNEHDFELTDIHEMQVGEMRNGLWERMRAWFRGEDLEETPGPASAELNLSKNQRQQVRDALQKWKDAVAYFENVDDPELVEYAVYEMEAAKRRYIFLLKNSHMI